MVLCFAKNLLIFASADYLLNFSCKVSLLQGIIVQHNHLQICVYILYLTLSVWLIVG